MPRDSSHTPAPPACCREWTHAFKWSGIDPAAFSLKNFEELINDGWKFGFVLCSDRTLAPYNSMRRVTGATVFNDGKNLRLELDNRKSQRCPVIRRLLPGQGCHPGPLDAASYEVHARRCLVYGIEDDDDEVDVMLKIAWHRYACLGCPYPPVYSRDAPLPTAAEIKVYQDKHRAKSEAGGGNKSVPPTTAERDKHHAKCAAGGGNMRGPMTAAEKAKRQAKAQSSNQTGAGQRKRKYVKRSYTPEQKAKRAACAKENRMANTPLPEGWERVKDPAPYSNRWLYRRLDQSISQFEHPLTGPIVKRGPKKWTEDALEDIRKRYKETSGLGKSSLDRCGMVAAAFSLTRFPVTVNAVKGQLNNLGEL